MEKRRKKAGKLFAKECSAPDVARRLGVARQVAYRWKSAWDQGGSQALASKGPAGPKAKLTVAQTQQVTEALLAGPVAHGYKTALWTLPRVASLIEDLTGVGYLSSGSCLAVAWSQWFQLPTSRTPGGGARRTENPPLAADGVAGIKKRPGSKGEPSSLLTKAG